MPVILGGVLVYEPKKSYCNKSFRLVFLIFMIMKIYYFFTFTHIIN